MDNQYSSFYLYRKYEVVGDELIDLGITSIDAEGTQEPVMKEECDPECGCIEPQYRWVVVPGGYECSGTTKMTQEKEQVSLDSGVTWNDVSPLTTRAILPVIEQYSQDCGYVPLTRWVQTEDTVCIEKFGGKYKLTLNNHSVVSATCDSSSSVTSGEVANQYSGTVVSAEIGDCTTSIKKWAFHTCRSLTSVTIPDSVTSIGDAAFVNCSGLTRINSDVNGVFNIPTGITTISEGVFDGCKNLVNITIPSGVTSIGAAAFQLCTSLSAVTIPSGVKTIPNHCFYQCTSLPSITIPSGVTNIGESAFISCSGLTSVTIPSGVTSIGQYAFWGCSGLTSVTVLATTPPSLGSFTNIYPFDNTNNCPIYVPAGSVNTYKSASGWSNYESRIQAIS